jgi:non-specific serine/threonine protein kinase
MVGQSVSQQAIDRETSIPDSSSLSGVLSAWKAAQALGVNERTIRRAIARGELTATKQGRSFRITVEDLDRYRTSAAAHAGPGAFSAAPRAGTSARPVLVSLRQPAPSRLGSLPAPLTRFIGREREVATIAALIRQDDVRLVTLTGPGGVGKTRLVLRVAEEIGEAFADGAVFVELAPVRNATDVLTAVAAAVGVPDVGRRSLRDSLVGVLHERDQLLVLDNFEHVLPAASQIADLLISCPSLRVLASSRAPLGMAGERLFPVNPLPVPPTDHTGPDYGPAVALFAERARAIAPEFQLSVANTPTVVRICRHLEGLPLALELAAARTRVLSLSALLARLDDRLALLTRGTCDLPLRLRSLEDAIAWSYDLLAPTEQWLFRQQAVFVGGFTIEAVAAPEIPDPLGALQALVDHSLVTRGEDELGETRFTMLETIREFALARLTASGEEKAAQTSHAAWFLTFAERADPVRIGPEKTVWFDRLEAELPNLRAALAWFLAQGDAERGLRLAVALEWFWSSRGYLREARQWLETFLAIPTALHTRARGLLEAANICHWQGDLAAAEAYADQARTTYLTLGDDHFAMLALRKLGHIVLDQGDLERAASLLAACEALLPATGKAWDLAFAIYLAGCLAAADGQDVMAVARFAEAASAFGAIGDHAYVAAARGQQGSAALSVGDLAGAAIAYAESLDLAVAARDQTWVAWALTGAAHLAHAAGAPTSAARLLGGAAAIRAAIGEGRLPKTALADAVRGALGETCFADAWAQGLAAPAAGLTADARAIYSGHAPGQPTPASRLPAPRLALTLREREVLRLLVDGLSDKEIAVALGISRHTASNHVRTMRDKLGVPSRAAVVATAMRDGLV